MTREREFVPVRWGILGTAGIARRQVVPALQRSSRARVLAIASRSAERAREAAATLRISRAYGSYDALLDDPDIEAIYNPLPNHLHVPWTIRAAERGKHVLCEKPLALSADEAATLLAVRAATGVQIAEAFMVRTHPQWLAARKAVQDGRIGSLRLVSGHFSYFRRDAADIRSRPEWGGGALMDVGCYPITMARWIYGEEPIEVIGQLEHDPDFHVDRLGSALLRFPSGQATLSFGSQLALSQRVQLFGTQGHITVDVPFSPPADHATRLVIDDARDAVGGGRETMTFPPVNQYTVQADHFAGAVRGLNTVAVGLEDAVANMRVIDALFRSAETRRWESPAQGTATGR